MNQGGCGGGGGGGAAGCCHAGSTVQGQGQAGTLPTRINRDRDILQKDRWSSNKVCNKMV